MSNILSWKSFRVDRVQKHQLDFSLFHVLFEDVQGTSLGVFQWASGIMGLLAAILAPMKSEQIEADVFYVRIEEICQNLRPDDSVAGN